MNKNTSMTDKNSKIAAIVVLYFPDEMLLDRLINSIQSSVSCIIVVDNTPAEQFRWVSEEWFSCKHFNVIYMPLGDNYGIAKAQNLGIEKAVDNNCDHVILFDQDSAASAEMIIELLSEELALLARGLNVGAVGPAFIDEKTGEYAKVMRYGSLSLNRISINPHDDSPVQADTLIASGALIRVEVLKKVGLMREDLFIDGVDIEWALRAGNLGYQHFVIPKAVMLHSMGDGYVVVGNRKINLHNDTRHYYMVRNSCCLALSPMMGRKFRTNIFLRIPVYVLFYTITSKSRFSSLKLLLRACLDGFSGRLGKAV